MSGEAEVVGKNQEFNFQCVEIEISHRAPNSCREAVGYTSVECGRDVWAEDIKRGLTVFQAMGFNEITK